MGETEYSEALKLGKKEYRARIAKGPAPYSALSEYLPLIRFHQALADKETVL